MTAPAEQSAYSDGATMMTGQSRTMYAHLVERRPSRFSGTPGAYTEWAARADAWAAEHTRRMKCSTAGLYEGQRVYVVKREDDFVTVRDVFGNDHTIMSGDLA